MGWAMSKPEKTALEAIRKNPCTVRDLQDALNYTESSAMCVVKRLLVKRLVHVSGYTEESTPYLRRGARIYSLGNQPDMTRAEHNERMEQRKQAAREAASIPSVPHRDWPVIALFGERGTSRYTQQAQA